MHESVSSRTIYGTNSSRLYIADAGQGLRIPKWLRSANLTVKLVGAFQFALILEPLKVVMHLSEPTMPQSATLPTCTSPSILVGSKLVLANIRRSVAELTRD